MSLTISQPCRVQREHRIPKLSGDSMELALSFLGLRSFNEETKRQFDPNHLRTTSCRSEPRFVKPNPTRSHLGSSPGISVRRSLGLVG
jgi:hypothetical protein